MTDLVTTKLFITGSIAEIQQFRSDCIRDYIDNGYKDIRLDFEDLVPTPDVFLKDPTDPDQGVSSEKHLVNGMDWYGWRLQFWGTKWSSHAFREIFSDAENYHCVFDTACDCPEPIIAAIAERYPSFEGRTETREWCSMTMRVGSIFDGDFVLDTDGYDFEEKSEDFEDDELDHEAEKVELL